MKTICIIGGGSLGHVCAGVFAANGYRVSMLTGHPDKWEKEISVIDCEGKVFSGSLTVISSSPEEVIPQADIVLLCLPGYLIEDKLREIAPFVSPKTLVGSIVSSTGFFFIAHRILPATTQLFGFQRVPFIARVDQYGKSAKLLGYKSLLKIAVENCTYSRDFAIELSVVLKTPVTLLDNYYEASLTNSNPILHTGRLFTLWRDPQSRRPIKNPIMFYSDWTDEASETLIAMDEEFGELLKVLGVSREVVPTLLDYYESSDAKGLTAKLRSIPAFMPIPAPMKKIDEGWVPDFSSRYFTEDFPYGLRYIRDFARMHNIPTPVIDRVYSWGLSVISLGSLNI
ncbi:MAG: NAD/NADP octopine/nopaline dehydrogenase family protein [Muribaculum sp.]|nr:NAD/NADP octopine/nopaline dehydrogenase family protein [Muribaculum sp.]